MEASVEVRLGRDFATDWPAVSFFLRTTVGVPFVTNRGMLASIFEFFLRCLTSGFIFFLYMVYYSGGVPGMRYHMNGPK